MAAKVLSIEVGESSTKVIEMDQGTKTPKIYNAFSFETPPNTLTEEGVAVNDAMLSLMRQGLSQNGIRTNKAIFTISSSRIANRDVTIPVVKDNKIKQLLLANSRDYFPVDLSQYELVYRITERLKEEKQIKLSVYAVPRSLIVSYQQLARAWNFQLLGMDYSGNSIYQAMMHTMDQALAVTVCVNDKSTMLTIIKDGRVELQRTVAYGIDEVVETVRKSKAFESKATYQQALDLLREKVCINQQFQQDSDMDDWDDYEDQEIMDVRGNATQSLNMLIGNVARILDYYTSRNQEVKLEEIELIGLGAECKGLDKLLANELGVDVQVARDKKGISIARSLSRNQFRLAEYMVAVGATFEPFNFAMETQVATKGKTSSGGDYSALMLLAFLVLLGASAAMAVIPLMQNMSLEQDNESMRTEILSKQSVVEIYNNYLVQRKTNVGMVAADSNASVPNEAFLDFLEEMEEHMPKDLRVESLSVSENIMTIAAVCTNKPSVAEALMQLRTFDTILDVTCSGVSEEENDAGVKEEHFDITLTYKPPVSEEESEETADGDADMETTEAQ
ncbi:MAG: pilus assembly protein PilM [Blautia sp.]|nr:pilus assembly protein PilM [Blautia sp.]